MIFNINEIWNARTLIWVFAFNDLKSRYNNTVLGFFWSLLEPILILAIFYFIFTYLFVGEIENYALYLLLGIVLWRMFQKTTSRSLTSITSRASLITRIYFPREILPISSTISSSITLLLETTIFFIFMIPLGFIPPTTIFLLPVVLVLLFLITLGMSFVLSCLNVFYRDIQYIWTVVLQAGFFLTPIIYKIDLLPENIQNILYLNPLTHILEMAHNSVLYGILPSTTNFIIIILFSMSIAIFGYILFRSLESKMVEQL